MVLRRNLAQLYIFPLNPLIKKKDNSVIPVKIKIIFLKETLSSKIFITHIILFSEKKMCGTYRKAMLAVYLITVGHLFALYFRVFFFKNFLPEMFVFNEYKLNIENSNLCLVFIY